MRREAQRADVRWIAQRLKTPGGRKKLHAALRRAA
jgi:hypothetical protein